MFSLSPVLTFQLILIGLGLIFQFIAFTALKKDVDHEGNEAADHSHDHENFDLGAAGRQRRRSARRDSVHDYYKMDYVPPNVRAGDLRKTAKVTFFDDSAKPPPPPSA
jgi:hypothetical protein